MKNRARSNGMGLWGKWLVAFAIGAAMGLTTSRKAGADIHSDIQGSWMSSCYVQAGQHLKKDIYVVSSKIYTTQSLYKDAGCFDLKIQLEQVQGYSIEASNQVAGATNVDLVAERSFLTVFDSATANSWDHAKFCGISDWDVGIPREVTGRDCAGHVMPKAGDKEYDLYLRESYSKLWIGLRSPSLDGSTPEKRPHELDRTVGFRQLTE